MAKAKMKKKRVSGKKVAVAVVRPGRGGGDGCGDEEERGAGVGEVGVRCPVCSDPAMGDKTPGVMAWYRENLPVEYARRYGNRVCPEVGTVVQEMDVRGPVSDFEDEVAEVVKPRVIMG